MENLGIETDCDDSVEVEEGLDIPDFDSLCLNPYR